tara:strand:- start:4605 stop:4946 length:342 start_codon:yes stop_codon:yes gene_type:complete
MNKDLILILTSKMNKAELEEKIKKINLERLRYQLIFDKMEERGECGDHVDDIIILLEECEEAQELLENIASIEEEREKEIALAKYQDAVKGGLFDCDDITFESEEALSQKGEL